MSRLSLGMLWAFGVAAQTVEPEMSADRPGFRNSTHLVGPGVVQVENGLTLSTGRAMGLQPELRVGALRWLELRVLTDDIVLRQRADTPRAGVSDLQVGAKFPIFERVKKTRVVGIVKATLPTGHSS